MRTIGREREQRLNADAERETMTDSPPWVAPLSFWQSGRQGLRPDPWLCVPALQLVCLYRGELQVLSYKSCASFSDFSGFHLRSSKSFDLLGLTSDVVPSKFLAAVSMAVTQSEKMQKSDRFVLRTDILWSRQPVLSGHVRDEGGM